MRSRPLSATLFALALLLAGGHAGHRAASAEAAEITVVATIAPVHGIAEAIMKGSGNRPGLLLAASVSPHLVQLRPSQAAMLETADLILRVGDTFETFLSRLLAPDIHAGRLLTLDQLPGIILHPNRRAGLFGHDPAGADTHAHAGIPFDPHLWLDPENGRTAARAIAERLAALDPEHAPVYLDNADRFDVRLLQVEREIDGMLATVRERPYLVLHDAFGSFERRFGLHPAGAFAISPDRRPGPRRLDDLRHIVSNGDIACIFTEPQLDTGWIDTILAEEPVRKGVLDPLGSTLPADEEHYPRLLLGIARSLRDCLSP